MAKTRKPSTARTPPTPSDSHGEIEVWIRSAMRICSPSSIDWTN